MGLGDVTESLVTVVPGIRTLAIAKVCGSWQRAEAQYWAREAGVSLCFGVSIRVHVLGLGELALCWGGSETPELTGQPSLPVSS